MGKVDRTFSDLCLWGSDAWAAETLGWPLAKFQRERKALEAEGFPTVDPVTGLTNKADVVAWSNRRRKFADRAIVEASDTTGGTINHDKA